ncbi:hypothetical protein BASA62_003730 [Batrachochytrium salamandrivorans]|nr:hypothetical protein BASA62_003730 [Batrachochytrium salamandrivorans]
MQARQRTAPGAPTRPPRAKPVRYWPGKAPVEAGALSSDSDHEASGDEDPITAVHDPLVVQSSDHAEHSDEDMTETVAHRRSYPAVPSTSQPSSSKDRRLARLAAHRNDSVEPDTASSHVGDGPLIRVTLDSATVLGVDGHQDASQDDINDQEEALQRREKIRERALQQRTREDSSAAFIASRKALARAKVKDDDEIDPVSRDGNSEIDDEEDASSEEDDDEEDDEDTLYRLRPMLKPVFVPKKHRETVLERDRLIQEQDDAEKTRLEKLKDRKKESRDLVDEVLQKELSEAQVAAETLDIDDTDGIDEVAEYEAWKLRELLRIMKDRSEREQREAEQREMERRRHMTDAEIAADNQALGMGVEKSKIKHKFMQKYYHKGAFYVDDARVGDALCRADADAPTGEDQFDKSMLPAVMQVKNFGRAGQTKYTHLLDQDTSRLDSAWSQKTDVNRKMTGRLGGMKSEFEKPSMKKRKTGN